MPLPPDPPDDPTAIEYMRDAVRAGELESCTTTPTEDVPTCVGVPLICPSGPTRDNPKGRAPDEIDQL